MTNLKDINFGLNQYCGPAVLSALTGESTDRCAAVISAVSGKTVIKAVERAHIKEAFKRLRFDVKDTDFRGSTLYGTLYRMHNYDGFYVVFVPNHVVAVEVNRADIFIVDNHSKTVLDIKQSARLMQKVEEVWKVTPKDPPKFLRSETRITKWPTRNAVQIQRFDIYENKDDNKLELLGQFTYKDNLELHSIIGELSLIATGRE